MQLNTHEKEAYWLEKMLDIRKMSASYKAYWMMSIIDIITEEERSEITFVEVVNRMIKHAWYPVVTFKLSFGVQDRLSHMVEYLNLTYPEIRNMKDSEILPFLSNEKLALDKEFISRRKNLYQMVPYRLLSPFFETELKDEYKWKKNNLIAELASADYISMYTIDAENRVIHIRRNWMDYIIDNQAVIKGWIQYKLTLYLQARNLNVPNIMTKLRAPSKRNLTKAKKFWESVIEDKIVKDIYTGKALKQINFVDGDRLSIDHFIPWSYVVHDEFWNLCPTFSTVNSSKSDNLPKLDIYLDKFCDVHHFAVNELKARNKNKVLEDYYSLGHEDMVNILSTDEDVSRKVIHSAISKTIKPIHQIAMNQGFGVWEYQ